MLLLVYKLQPLVCLPLSLFTNTMCVVNYEQNALELVTIAVAFIKHPRVHFCIILKYKYKYNRFIYFIANIFNIVNNVSETTEIEPTKIKKKTWYLFDSKMIK